MVFFAADDGVHGDELWKSDGTGAGTVLVKDIDPGSSGSMPEELTDVNGVLYFTADDGVHGRELWRSDGTEAGTVLVADIRPGKSGGVPQDLTAVGGTLFFAANDGGHGDELWESDGTQTGTILVKDISSGKQFLRTSLLTAVGTTLFFADNDGVHGEELWKSDGTDAGTLMVKDINPGSSGSLYSGGMFGNPTDFLMNVNGTLFFSANDGTHGDELWKSDGTPAGTVLVKDILPGSASAFKYDTSRSASNLAAVGSTLYFTATDGTTGFQLWKSDGTAAGTVIVKEINPGGFAFYPYVSFGQILENVNGTLFFSADDGTHGYELWKTDGSAAGTVLVKDIQDPDLGPSYFSGSKPGEMVNLNGTLYFAADDGINGRELWRSDGTGGRHGHGQ